MIWECSEGQWRGIDSIQPCPVSLLGWEIDLRRAGQGMLRGPAVLAGKMAELLLGPASTTSQKSLSQKVK